jgi:pyruvate/2-oxoacid:ferredoxin oxidoreductase beta subunit
MRLVIISSLIIFLSACISYTDETEQKFQENKNYMHTYLEELGYKNSPFLTRVPDDKSDKQKKKMIALMTKEELKNFMDRQTSNVPKINMEHSRTNDFLNEVNGLRPKKAYNKLIEDYPELLIEN